MCKVLPKALVRREEVPLTGMVVVKAQALWDQQNPKRAQVTRVVWIVELPALAASMGFGGKVVGLPMVLMVLLLMTRVVMMMMLVKMGMMVTQMKLMTR